MEKKQIKISLGTLVIGIIAIILLVVIMGMYITNTNQELEKNQITMANKGKVFQDNNDTTQIEKNYNVRELDVNSNLVQKLYGYIYDKNYTGEWAFSANSDPNTHL